MFLVHTDLNPSPIFLSPTSVSELVTTCSDFLGHGRPSSSEVVQCACPKATCSRGRHCRLPKLLWSWITSDPSLECSVNKTLSGAWTPTGALMLGQYQCKRTHILQGYFTGTKAVSSSPQCQWINPLTHCLVVIYDDIDLGQHWLR